jgi:hypothetical protein
MKGKSTTYILLLLVIGIWAWIMYNVYDYVGDDRPPVVLQKHRSNKIVDSVEGNKKYRLKLDYIDPFLKRGIKYSESITNNASPLVIKTSPVGTTAAKEDSVVLPEFAGLISNKKGNVAILIWAGKEYMLQEGDKIEHMTILKITKDSVKLSIDKKVYYVKKN